MSFEKNNLVRNLTLGVVVATCSMSALAKKNELTVWYLFTRTGLTASVLPGWDNLSSRCTP